MFSPACKCEYSPSIKKCPECNTKLVERLPVDESEHDVNLFYVEILSTSNLMDIALIKSLLDSEDITYFFQGEHFIHVRPLVVPARLMVRSDQVEEAKEILKDLDLNYMAFNLQLEESEEPSE
jgi:hypothetical protein